MMPLLKTTFNLDPDTFNDSSDPLLYLIEALGHVRFGEKNWFLKNVLNCSRFLISFKHFDYFFLFFRPAQVQARKLSSCWLNPSKRLST